MADHGVDMTVRRKSVRKNSIKHERILNIVFRSSLTANSVVNGGTWPKFELTQAFMHVLVTCKNEEDPIKNEVARVGTTFLPFKV